MNVSMRQTNDTNGYKRTNRHALFFTNKPFSPPNRKDTSKFRTTPSRVSTKTQKANNPILKMKFITVATIVCTMAIAGVVSASSFVAYSQDHFAGASQTLRSCGCQSISYHGSFRWYGEGQTGRMFDSDGCQGVAQNTLPSDQNQEGAYGYGWKSIDIIC